MPLSQTSRNLWRSFPRLSLTPPKLLVGFPAYYGGKGPSGLMVCLSHAFRTTNSESWGGANLQNVFTEVMDSMADQTGNNSCNNDGCAPPLPQILMVPSPSLAHFRANWIWGFQPGEGPCSYSQMWDRQEWGAARALVPEKWGTHTEPKEDEQRGNFRKRGLNSGFTQWADTAYMWGSLGSSF